MVDSHRWFAESVAENTPEKTPFAGNVRRPKSGYQLSTIHYPHAPENSSCTFVKFLQIWAQFLPFTKVHRIPNNVYPCPG
jgi:hypothetical protein